MSPAEHIIKTFSGKFYSLSMQEIEAIAGITKYRIAAKNERLLDTGQTARHITYVEKGMLRQFYYKNGHDITEHFACEGSLMFCIKSLFRKEPTSLMVEAIEPSSLYGIPYEQLLELSEKSVAIGRFVNRILEWGLISSQDKADSWRFETAKERYKRFCIDFPEAAKRASVNDIASYLLMAPETLSRIRAEITGI